MIIEIERAKSSLSRCKCCKQVIKKDQVRGIAEVPYGNYVTKSYYCMSCSLNILHSQVKHTEKLIKKITNYVKN